MIDGEEGVEEGGWGRRHSGTDDLDEESSTVMCWKSDLHELRDRE